MSESALEFELLGLFPDHVVEFCRQGLIGKAMARDRIRLHATNFREFATDKHRTVDDAPFGGGAGMVLRVDVVVAALEHVERVRGPFHRILLTPSGPTFTQSHARRLAGLSRIGLVCGRYEGIDDRVRDHFVDECLSLGDFVLNGGEVAAAAIVEAVARLREGVLGNPESSHDDSFTGDGTGVWLEHPQYTRPAEFRGLAVPEVLLTGDHQAVARWRRLRAGRRTWALRPELREAVSHALPPAVWLAIDEADTSPEVPACSGLSGIARVGDARALRKVVGTRPRVVGLGSAPATAPASVEDLRALLDLLCLADSGEEAPALVFAWPTALAVALGAELWYAPNPWAGSELASAQPMTDISQPRDELGTWVRSLCAALETPGERHRRGTP